MKDFKVGDRVRFVGEEGPWFERQIIEGDEGVVVGKGFYEDELCVSFSTADDVSVSNLELVESPDPKTAFLTELQSLLKRHDARIYPYGLEIDGLGICFGDSSEDLICYNMDDFSPMGELNADNIFNYDKD